MNSLQYWRQPSGWLFRLYGAEQTVQRGRTEPCSASTNRKYRMKIYSFRAEIAKYFKNWREEVGRASKAFIKHYHFNKIIGIGRQYKSVQTFQNHFLWARYRSNSRILSLNSRGLMEPTSWPASAWRKCIKSNGWPVGALINVVINSRHKLLWPL